MTFNFFCHVLVRISANDTVGVGLALALAAWRLVLRRDIVNWLTKPVGLTNGYTRSMNQQVLPSVNAFISLHQKVKDRQHELFRATHFTERGFEELKSIFANPPKYRTNAHYQHVDKFCTFDTGRRIQLTWDRQTY